jgi:WD40 repeat protein
VRTGKGDTDPALTALNPFLFSPDGRFAAGWGGRDEERGADWVWCARFERGRWAEIWRKEFGYDTEENGSSYRLIEFSADSGQIARIFEIGPYQSVMRMGVEVFATQSGKAVARWEGQLPWELRQGAVGPTGVVVVFGRRTLHAVNPRTPDSEPVKRENASSRHFTWVAFSRDGTRLASTSNDTAATVWDTSTWQVRKRYEWQIGRLRTVCFAPDGLRCAAGSDTGQVVVWDLDE